MSHTLEQLTGQLLVVGFAGLEPPPALLHQIAQGHVGGVILFSHNVGHPRQVLALTHAVHQAAPPDSPLLVAVDQEGGRVQRLRQPLAVWPPMSQVGALGHPKLTRLLGQAMGQDLRWLGFNLNFAPVLDVVTSAKNVVIGDRSFGSTAEIVIAHGLALAEGLREGGVLPCGKHFPGHGGPVADSHLTLPIDPRPAEELTELDLWPFVAAIGAGLPMLMTAHVLYPNLDREQPATLSRLICTELLREQLGFTGALISDDLDMGAIAKTHGPGAAALAALRAGSDLLLFCQQPEHQQLARQALIEAARSCIQDRKRLEEAADRVRTLKANLPAMAEADPEEILELVRAEAHEELLQELNRQKNNGFL